MLTLCATPPKIELLPGRVASGRAGKRLGAQAQAQQDPADRFRLSDRAEHAHRNTVLIGAANDDKGSLVDAGSAHVFVLTATNLMYGAPCAADSECSP
jgi:hypothetical protein